MQAGEEREKENRKTDWGGRKEKKIVAVEDVQKSLNVVGFSMLM